ncbi:MAG: hypothetical protein AAGF26_20470 [Cyanobacteria bacterium P01_G01_bin.49]
MSRYLLEFIDANELTRSGAFTLTELQTKLKGMTSQDVAEAIDWLELERLITPIQQGEETAYELAHERMIPAVIKISGKILPKAYKANELLNKKVKIWIENDYSSRYLLGVRELWFIEAHKQYLIWGTKQQQKEKLIQQSKRKLYRNFGILGTILLFLIAGWGWLNHTTAGQLWQIRRELAYWSGKVNDGYKSQAAIAFAKDGKIRQMNQLLDQVENSDDKAETLGAIAQAYSQLQDPNQAVKLLEQALEAANQIESSDDKARALSAISQAQANLKRWGDALATTKKCPSHDCRVWSLSAVLRVYAEFKNPELKDEEE